MILVVLWLLLVVDDSFVNFLFLNEFLWDVKLVNCYFVFLWSYMEYKCGFIVIGVLFVVNGNIIIEYVCMYFLCDVNFEIRGSLKNNWYLNLYCLLILFIIDVFVCFWL